MHTSSPTLFPDSPGFDVLVVAASLGGPQVLHEIFSALPADFPVPIVVVQHLSAGHPSPMGDLLADRVQLRVEWAREGARLRARTIHLAPPGRHLTIAPDCTLHLFEGQRVSHAQPAADLLFASAAERFGARALGLILTGRLCDGTAGALAIRQAGGVVLAQDPGTCRAPGMPLAAIGQEAVDFVLPPGGIASALVSLVMVPGARSLFGVESHRAAS